MADDGSTFAPPGASLFTAQVGPPIVSVAPAAGQGLALGSAAKVAQAVLTGSTLVTGDIVWSAAVTRAGAVPATGGTYDGTNATYTPLWVALGSVLPQNAFVVPDIRDRVPVGAGGNTALLANDGIAAANRHGSRHRHTTVVNESPHTHQITSNDVFNHTASSGATGTAAGDRNLLNITGTGSSVTGLTVTTGASASDPLDGPAFVGLNPFIVL